MSRQPMPPRRVTRPLGDAEVVDTDTMGNVLSILEGKYRRRQQVYDDWLDGGDEDPRENQSFVSRPLREQQQQLAQFRTQQVLGF